MTNYSSDVVMFSMTCASKRRDSVADGGSGPSLAVPTNSTANAYSPTLRYFDQDPS